MTNRNVTIYACGGAATNVVSKLSGDSGKGMAEYKSYFIDTSNSNMRKANINAEDVYLYEGLDGSGKVRAENHEVISKNMLKIIQQFKPSTFNIVVHSGSGGSGAVIGASLVAELKKRGEQVIVILIGSTNSHIEIENTLKTLKSYDVIADRVESPIVVHYLENSEINNRQVIDGCAIKAIMGLLMLFSGKNDELDTADLRNWMKHPKLAQELVALNFCITPENYKAAGTVVTVATLATHGVSTTVSPLPAYQAVGYILESELKEDALECIHYTISSDLISGTAKLLSNKLKEVDEHLNSSPRRSSLVDRNDNPTSNGLIL